MATLVRWEPFRDLASVHTDMSRLMNAFFDKSDRAPQSWAPPLDVWETETELVYAFDLPGIPEERISIEIQDDTLTVSAERVRVTDESDDRYFRFERRHGVFTRAVGLPPGVDDSRIDAKYVDGVLEVHVPKPEEAKPRKIQLGSPAPADIARTASKAN